MAWERLDDSTSEPEVRLEESGMTVFRPGVELLRRKPPSAEDVVSGLIHDWCERPHDICVCQDNPLRRPAAAVHREKAEMVRRAQRSAA